MDLVNRMYGLASSTWDEEEIAVSTKILQSGKLTMGQEVREFEDVFEFLSFNNSKNIPRLDNKDDGIIRVFISKI